MDRESSVDKPENTVDENTDTDISKDERKCDSDDVILPRKQKLRGKRTYSTIPNMKNHQTNKGGNRLEWTTKKPSSENNPRNAGRRSAVNISSTYGPTP